MSDVRGILSPGFGDCLNQRGSLCITDLKMTAVRCSPQKCMAKNLKSPLVQVLLKQILLRLVELESGIADYKKAFQAFANIGDYFTINISCPNVFGGEPFSDPIKLDALLMAIDLIPTKKPIFLKLAVDLAPSELDEIVRIADKHRVHGFILANLTKNKDKSIDKRGGAERCWERRNKRKAS